MSRNILINQQFYTWHETCLFKSDPNGSPSQLTLLVNTIFILYQPIDLFLLAIFLPLPRTNDSYHVLTIRNKLLPQFFYFISLSRR